MTTVPLIEVRGNRRELGRQHGEACREHIRGYAALLATLLARDGSNQLPGVRQRRSPDELARPALPARHRPGCIRTGCIGAR